MSISNIIAVFDKAQNSTKLVFCVILLIAAYCITELYRSILAILFGPVVLFSLAIAFFGYIGAVAAQSARSQQKPMRMALPSSQQYEMLESLTTAWGRRQRHDFQNLIESIEVEARPSRRAY